MGLLCLHTHALVYYLASFLCFCDNAVGSTNLHVCVGLMLSIYLSLATDGINDEMNPEESQSDVMEPPSEVVVPKGL